MEIYNSYKESFTKNRLNLKSSQSPEKSSPDVRAASIVTTSSMRDRHNLTDGMLRPVPTPDKEALAVAVLEVEDMANIEEVTLLLDVDEDFAVEMVPEGVELFDGEGKEWVDEGMANRLPVANSSLSELSTRSSKVGRSTRWIAMRRVGTDEVLRYFPSQRSAGETLGVQPTLINQCCLGKKLAAYGFTWSVCDMPENSKYLSLFSEFKLNTLKFFS